MSDDRSWSIPGAKVDTVAVGIALDRIVANHEGVSWEFAEQPEPYAACINFEFPRQLYASLTMRDADEGDDPPQCSLHARDSMDDANIAEVWMTLTTIGDELAAALGGRARR